MFDYKLLLLTQGNVFWTQALVAVVGAAIMNELNPESSWIWTFTIIAVVSCIAATYTWYLESKTPPKI